MKINVKKVALIVLCATLVTTCVASTTFSRYKTSMESSDITAKAARWGFDSSASVTINLFKSSYGTDAAAASGTSYDIVAPGTSGSSAITLSSPTDAPEVSYTLTVSLNSSGIASELKDLLEFSWDGSNYTTALEDYTMDYAAGELPDSSNPVVLYWRWLSTHSADDDNAAAGKTATVKVSVVAEQSFAGESPE